MELENDDKVRVLSTGVPAVDDLLGIGGWPRGRVVEIYGNHDVGKTTLALHGIAAAQAAGLTAAYIDLDQTLNTDYARALGVDTDDLLVGQPDSGEDALKIVEALVRSGAVDLVVVDSVAALVPQAEIEGEMGDAHVGLQARLMSQALRKLTGAVSRTGCIVIFINQVCQKIGITFGSGETTTGGNALKFYASVRVDMRHGGPGEVRVKIVKNKFSGPFTQNTLLITPGRGFTGVLMDVLRGEQPLRPDPKPEKPPEPKDAASVFVATHHDREKP